MLNWTFTLLKSIINPLKAPICRYSIMSDSKRVAVCQMTSVADKEANLQVVSKFIDEAAKDKAEMIFFPEACDYICDNKNDIVKLAEPILTGYVVTKYRELAAEHNVWLSMGGVHEKDTNDPTKMFNTHIIIDNKGAIVQAYRKLHLFDVEIPEKRVRLKESDFTSAGAHVVTPLATPIGNLGLATCYDMRFPELSTSLGILNASALAFPSAFTQPTGEAHWHVLLRARAIENQCYVIAAAQVGQHNSKRRSYGHALIVDPWGEVVVDCGAEGAKWAAADVRGERRREVREKMPVFQHRRKDIYSLHTLSLRKDLLPEHNQKCADKAAGHTHNIDPQCKGPTNVFGHVKVPDSCVFYKSKLTYAFVNLRCVLPGHVLVAPIRLAERNQDLSEEEAEDFYRTIRLVQKLMEKVHSASSCTVTIQDGVDAGQTVKHLHCHIMPRKKGDFLENDLIYLELAKHDHFKSGHPCKPERALCDMESEAKSLRDELSKLLSEKELTR